MTARRPVMWSRTAFLRLALALPAPILLAACGGPASANDPREAMPQSNGTTGAPSPTPRPAATGQAPASQATGQAGAALPPTPECADEDDVTPTQTEGPYFKPRSPERASLVEPNLAGTRLVVTGRVLATDCRPVARALLDFWQADDGGAYDNAGYRLRGHQFTAETGAYRLETIVPGLYPGRTRHIHVKVQAPNRPVLTTQLYFPGEARNTGDSIFNSALLLSVQDAGGGKLASFDFVLDVG